MPFRVDQIDHVELTVPSRIEAAKWYQHVLGLEIMPEFQFWADDPLGPLMIGTVDAGTKLALFRDSSQGSKRTVGFHLLAFRVSGTEFLRFLSLLESLQLRNSKTNIVTRHDVADHKRAFSIYFCDPWRHQLELTTYDHDIVRAQINA